MYQLIKQILKDNSDKTKISLVLGFKTEKDILLTNELDVLRRAFPDRLKIEYVIQNPETNQWNGSKGLINESLLKNRMPAPGSNGLIIVCGPEG